MNWFKRRRERLAKEIAAEVSKKLEAQGWNEFLPPVAFRDCVYLVTKNGSIYRMTQDMGAGMEQICQIRSMGWN